jgi:hypothetical protein
MQEVRHAVFELAHAGRSPGLIQKMSHSLPDRLLKAAECEFSVTLEEATRSMPARLERDDYGSV